MNRTQIIGITMFIIGMGTIFYYQRGMHSNMESVGSIVFFSGALIFWNGWVANVNREPSFAIFG